MSEVMMSWTKKAVIDPAPVERLLRRSVKVRQWMGLKVDHAFEDTAMAVGTSPRRVRGFVRGEILSVAAEEYRRLLRRWRADIDRQAAEVIEMAIQMQKEADREWSAENQYSLPLDEAFSAPLASNTASGAGGARW